MRKSLKYSRTRASLAFKAVLYDLFYTITRNHDFIVESAKYSLRMRKIEKRPEMFLNEQRRSPGRFDSALCNMWQ